MVSQRVIPSKSWVLEGLCVGPSPIDGHGVFAANCIASGTIVIIWGGTVFSEEEVQSGSARVHTNVGISESRYLANSGDEALSVDDYMNHSCEPNVWMNDEIILVTSRDVEAGEELTADYSFWLPNGSYVMRKRCNCGSVNCRDRITGEDWKLPELQSRYQDHFSPFINERIRRLKGSTGT